MRHAESKLIAANAVAALYNLEEEFGLFLSLAARSNAQNKTSP
jgi:hypothetical protein